MKKISFIDLFSGAGGLLRGFVDAGLTPEFSLEVWGPAIATHHHNYPDIPIWTKDIRDVSNQELQPFKGKVDVIIGGPPCQGFSTIGKRLVKDPRNELVFEFIRFVNVIQPKMFLMENVRGLLSANNGKVKDAITEEFKAIGYNVIYDTICAADYGVPQLRQRVFFIGVRKDLGVIPCFPEKTHTKDEYVNVGDAIMDLVGKENQFSNHVPMKHNEIVKKRISIIKEGEGIPDEGLPEEVSKGSRSDYSNNTIKNFSHIYRRLSRYKPSTTMVPGHNAFPLHPTEDRSLTVREAARLQTFPDDVVFLGTRQEQCIQVGNAVPIRLSYHMAKHILSLIEDKQ